MFMKKLKKLVLIVENYMINKDYGGISRTMKVEEIILAIYVAIPLKGDSTLKIICKLYINKLNFLKNVSVIKTIFIFYRYVVHIKSYEEQHKFSCKYCGKPYDKNYIRDHIKEVPIYVAISIKNTTTLKHI